MNTKLILAALMMSLSLAACGQKDEAPAEATTETAPPADMAPAPADVPADATDGAVAPADGMPADGMPADGTAPAEGGDAAEPAPAQ